ncbi:hypothetical protein [Paraburkholderia bannensis]|uniref:hypothetical protein n=1 Tax=Paraburkholderia bannensis TaxID=765414 RepID=UPI002AC31CE1|nr:hypothetical protein [Paraburkholderia bannensis]
MSEEVYTIGKVAAILREQFPDKTEEQWKTWLHNNRNGAKNAVATIPFVRVGKAAMYHPDDIAKFVDFEKSRRIGNVKLSGRAAEALRAFGIGEIGGGATGRKLAYTLTAQVDPATGRHYAQFITRDPLMVFRLEQDQVCALAAEFSELAANFKRWEDGK